MNKKFNPLLNYILRAAGNKQFKVCQRVAGERPHARDRQDPNSNNAVFNDEFRLALAP
ncbi:MAG TPA: hypothetical protein VN836_07490 [Verrucomicrobiae bacterium]|nr:hypothetical protein [Verrucomicrobiae bacterium]